ncbi:44519_t:CDS:2 [Gigaspora margarita]|uniref:44519_t:CDS:1 n=1 Tax=Gigaspora margarita TaxID=4874 RepID=A0ABN7V631_GIGMA|nr:44519_t:CDS:2 [Gigaspora margarita]
MDSPVKISWEAKISEELNLPLLKQSETQPYVTQSSVAQPSPSTTQPYVTQSSVTQPLVIRSPPSVTQPSVTQPSVTQSSVTQPYVTQPLYLAKDMLTNLNESDPSSCDQLHSE